MSAVVGAVDVVDEVDQEIARLQALIRVQQARRTDLVSISRASDEALTLVFRHLLGLGSRLRDPPFMHVCWRWRRVALANPSLWSTLEMWPLPRFRVLLARAKEAALSISAHLSLDHVRGYATTLANWNGTAEKKKKMAHLAKAVALLQDVVAGPRLLRQMTLQGSADHCHSVMARMRFPRPELFSLSIQAEGTFYSAHVFGVAFYEECAPSLQTLTIKNFGEGWQHVIGAALVHLSIDTSAAKILWSTLRSVLKKTPVLQTCRLVGCIADDLADIAVAAAPFAPTQLPCLSELVLHHLSIGVVLRWFEDFMTPSTCSVDLWADYLPGSIVTAPREVDDVDMREVTGRIGGHASTFSKTGEKYSVFLTRVLLLVEVDPSYRSDLPDSKPPVFRFRVSFDPDPRANYHERFLRDLVEQTDTARIRALRMNSHVPLSYATWSAVGAAAPQVASLHIYGWSGVVLLRLLATRRKRDEPVLLPNLETLIVEDMNLRLKSKKHDPEMSYTDLREALHMRAAISPIQTLEIIGCYYVEAAVLEGLQQDVEKVIFDDDFHAKKRMWRAPPPPEGANA
jgi:hypothetical protein